MSSKSKTTELCDHEDCGSRRFHIGDDGFTYCSRGHQQSSRGTQVAEDTGELVILGRKSRRQRDSDGESTGSKASTYSGTRAYEHYLLCLQLVLRKQLRWLIEFQRLPGELETLVHDLWALRLQSLQTRFPSAALFDSGTETETESHSQRQVFSSQSSGGEGDNSASDSVAFPSRRSSRSSKNQQPSTKTEHIPSPLDGLALCYIGTLLLREPLTISDFSRWVNEGNLLYYKIAKEVPLDMRERLPPTYQSLLEPLSILQAEKLHQRIFSMLATFRAEYGMAVPELNWKLVLYRWIEELGVPIETLTGAGRLAEVLQMGFGYEFQEDKEKGKRDVVLLRYPEVRLMTMLVCAVKVLFPFDEESFRSSTPSSSAPAFKVDWPTWASTWTTSTTAPATTATNSGTPSPLLYRDALAFTETDVLSANPDQLDQYMSWFEETFASEEIRERGRAGRDAEFRRAMFRMFPTEGVSGKKGLRFSSKEEAAAEERVRLKLREMQGILRARSADNNEREEREQEIRNRYRRHRHVEDLDGPVKILYERAAALAGLSLEGMVKAAFVVETRMWRVEEKLRKGG